MKLVILRKMISTDREALLSIWLAGNLETHDFIEPSYKKVGFQVTSRSIDEGTGKENIILVFWR